MGFWRKAVLGTIAIRALGPVAAPRFRAPQEHPWRQPGLTVFVGDSEYLVREAGPTDGDPVILMHGLAGSSLAEWYRIAPKLAEKKRVVLIDHRGHGLSVLNRGRYEVGDAADDIAGVLDQLGISKAAVVGYSLGGTIAQAFAYRYRGRVSKLILIGTFAHHPEPMRTARALGALLVRGFERLTGVGTSDVRAGYLLATGAVDREHGRWLWEETHRRDVDSGAQATLAMLRFDSRSWIGGVEVDSLVIIPTKDQLVPPAWQYQLASLLWNPEVVELKDARHEVPWVHAERLTEEIARFLD